MRKILVKFSDERNRKYSIRTVILEDERTGERSVVKEPVFPEGQVHMENIKRYEGILAQAYPDVDICPVELTEEGSLRFAYIQGVSLEKKYVSCMERGDRQGMEVLLEQHKKIVLGGEKNRCVFRMSPEFQDIFGLSSWAGSEDGLCVSNFDAIPGNVIFQGETPVFIDYEWVFTFPLPQELAIFHCVRDLYLHKERMESFYPLAEAMKYLGVKEELEVLQKAYEEFFHYVIYEEDGSSFAMGKSIHAKGQIDTAKELESLRQSLDFAEKNWKEVSESLAFAEKNWRETSQANAVMAQTINRLQQAWDAEKQNHQLHAQQLENAVQEQAKQSETWRIAYETVINSRTWRTAEKMKHLVKRK